MLLRHFNLREQPFGVTPDPRYLCATASHREALSSLLYGIESGLGFVTLTAKPGMGKTTLLFEVLRRMKETTKTVFLFQTIATPTDLVRALLLDLGIQEVGGTLVEMQSQLNAYLVTQHTAGRRLLVAIDEAQNLNESVLEAVRMLSNFETAQQKLMHIVLAGQPQLAEKLALPQLTQLRQRISIFAQLQPLTRAETAALIHHRLRIAGRDAARPIFTSSALALIAHHSQGIPRNINNICFNALSLACALQRKEVDAGLVKDVVTDLDLDLHIRQHGSLSAVPPGLNAMRGNGAGNEEPAAKTPRSTLRKLAAAAAACAAGLLFLSGAPVAHRVAASGTPVETISKRFLAADALSPSIVPNAVARGPARPRQVRVREGQTLSDICLDTFGKCSPAILRTILITNPSIHDPDHIELGQRVVLPAVSQSTVPVDPQTLSRVHSLEEKKSQ